MAMHGDERSFSLRHWTRRYWTRWHRPQPRRTQPRRSQPQWRTLCAAALLSLATPAYSQWGLDTGMQPYRPVAGVVGTLSLQAAGPSADLAALWTDIFAQYYPEADVQIDAQAGTAAAADLTQRDYDLVLMDRPLTAVERQRFTERNGYRPIMLRVALGAVAVYVDQNNPLQRLTLAQLDAIFSTTHRCSELADIRHWNQLGLVQQWQGRGIELFGPDSADGAYQVFRHHALCDGDFKPDLQLLPGGSGIAAAISDNDFALGFSEGDAVDTGVKPIAVAVKAEGPFLLPTEENIRTGHYPLSHYLYLYSNHPSGEGLSPLAREFINMVLSRTGQEVIEGIGYLPLTASDARAQLRKL
jgi:phosphate transport system substrate-binding protein